MKTTLLLQHWVVELCFLQAGRKKEKNRKQPCQGCLDPSPKLTNQVSLCSPREEVMEVWGRDACLLHECVLFCMQWEIRVPPTINLGLACLCITGAVILTKKVPPFQSCSLCKQLEVIDRDVITLWTPQEDPTSNSTSSRMGHGKRLKKRGQVADPLKSTWWQFLLSSKKTKCVHCQRFLLTLGFFAFSAIVHPGDLW